MATKTGWISSRAVPMPPTAMDDPPTDSRPAVICIGRLWALTVARWRRSWNSGVS